MFRGYRYPLKPTPAQAEVLGQWVGVTRLIYNICLEQRRDHWRNYQRIKGRSISWVSQSAEITELRRQFDFIKAAPSDSLTQAARQLDRAFANFFAKRASFPTPRRLGLNDSVQLRASDTPTRRLNAKWSEVRLPKLGWVRFRDTRPMSGEPRNATLRRIGGAWFISFACNIGEAPARNEQPSVGIDRGVANTFSLSTGEHFSLPDMTAIEGRKRRAQKALARRKRGSARHAKQHRRVAALSARMARIRTHRLHEASADIARRFGVVAIEDLNIKSMTASAKGTVDAPGRGVRQKAGLNRAILAQGWGAIATMLDYKLEAAGGRLVKVPAAYSSQTCPACGVIDAKSRESQAVFRCVACGHRAHADTTAAIEIRRRSTALLGVEGSQLRPPCEAPTLAA